MKMMQKYPLDSGSNTLRIPGGMCGFSFGVQPGERGLIQMWTLADINKPPVEVNIYVAVTGEQLPDNVIYSPLGTVLLNGGAFVVHALMVS